MVSQKVLKEKGCKTMKAEQLVRRIEELNEEQLQEAIYLWILQCQESAPTVPVDHPTSA